MFDPRPDFGRPDTGLLAALRAKPDAMPDTLCVDVEAGILVVGPADSVRSQPLVRFAKLFPGHAVSRNPDGSVSIRLAPVLAEPEAASC